MTFILALTIAGQVNPEIEKLSHQLVVKSLVRDGRLSEAGAYLDSLYAESGSPAYLLEAMEMWYSQGELLLVCEYGERYTKSHAPNRRVFELVLDAQLSLGGKNVERWGERALKEFPEDAEFNLFLGTVFDTDGRLEKALPYYRAATELSPDSVDYISALGSALYRLKQYPEALVQYRLADSILQGIDMPDFIHPWQVTGTQLLDWLSVQESRYQIDLGLGLSYEALDSVELALENYEFALSSLNAGVSMLRATSAFYGGTEIETLFDAAVAFKDPTKEVTLLLKLAELEIKRGAYSGAVGYLNQAVELDTLNPRVLRMLGLSLYMTGLSEQAVNPLLVAAALTPLDPDVHYYLARAFYDIDRLGEAISSIERSVALNPEPTRLLYGLSSGLPRGRLSSP